MSSGADVAEVRARLTDPRELCVGLGLIEGYKPGRQAGGGLLIRCPAHSENTPSCSVRRGRDGTIAVHCFACGFAGDALSLVAAARGLDLRSDFAAVLGEAASLAGVALDLHQSAAPRLAPTPAPTLDYPDAAEVAALWAAAEPVEADPDLYPEADTTAARYLAGRAIDPGTVDLRQLARVLPVDAHAPPWARCWGIPWPRSHRLILPVVDYLGEVRSLRAWRIDSPGSDAPKRTAPAGKALAGLLLACPTARRMLATDQAPWASKATPLDVLIVEGEPDFLTWATRSHDANGAPLAVLGIVAGSWCEAIADRIPDGSRVIVRTHQDDAGDRYAAEIKASLTGRAVTILDFQRGAAANQPDDNERAQRGLLANYLEGVEAEQAAEPAPPASDRVPRLLSPEEGTAALRAALRSPAPLTVVRSTTGAGKSAELRAWLATEATSDKPAALFVPTHRLGEQTQAGLLSLGVPSARPVGVGRVRLPVVQGEGAHACIHHEAADLLARAGGRVREELCPECPARKSHPSGGECPAYASGSTAAPIVVLQQPLLAPVLRQAADDLCNPSADPDKPPPALAIVDELPPLVARAPWAADEQARKRKLTAEMTSAALEALEPLLDAIRAALRSPLDRPRTLRDLLAVDLAVERTLAEARAVDPGALWNRSLPVRLARQSLAADTRGDALARLAAVAAFSELLGVVLEAAHEPDRPFLWPTESGPVLASLAPWVRQVRPFLAAGGRLRLLDATAPVEALRRLWPELEVHSIEVRDAPQVRRRLLIWQHGARGRHCSPDRSLLADEVRGPLRRLAAVAVEINARKIGVLTHKPLADALHAWLADRKADRSKPAPAWCPDELRQLVDDGAEIIPGHFGAQRGLDLWAECDLLATMGDPWPNLGAALIEAGVLELDAAAWTLETTRAELVQAWGRARPVHRQSPCVVVHLGALALAPESTWAPQWAGVAQEWPQRGRPPTVLPLTDPSTWPAERARLGLSRKAHAEALGLSWRTYRRKEPQGPAEAEPENDQETPAKMGGHNPQEEVFEVSSDTLLSSSSLIPDYAPPESSGFVPSGAPSSPAAPSPGEGGQGRPATVVSFEGPRRGQDRAACPSGGPSLAGARWPSETHGARAPGRDEGARVA